ncbi:MAG: ABC transporter ATP-binding protein/permease [Lachnospiraceae bacterium]|nr:ABC transporter ATP-binding protein/permease [Lachnospiraceae bacterium]
MKTVIQSQAQRECAFTGQALRMDAPEKGKRDEMKENGKTYTKTGMLLCFLRGSKGLFAASILASAVVAALDMVTPQIIRIVVDYCLGDEMGSLPVFVQEALAAAGGRTYFLRNLYLAAVAVLAVAVFSAVFQYLNTYLNARATERMVKTARDLLFSHIEELPFDWHMKNQTGDILQRCTSDVTTVRDFVSEQLVQVMRIAILILFSAFFMASMSWKLSLVVFLSVPVIVGYSWFFYRRIGHLLLQCDENEGVLSTITQENLTGVRVVRAFGREQYERERFRKQNVVYTDAWMDLCRLLSGFWASGDLLMGLQLMLIVVLGTVFCVRGELTAGELIAFISYNRRLIWPVRRLGRMLSEMSKAGVSMERLLYILNSPAEERNEAGQTPAMRGDIVFDHVTFAYEKDVPVLRDVSFRVAGGSTLGILGPTGSGKSTLMHLLNRLYDADEGRITVDGVDVRDMSLPWLRAHIGMVLQEPYLFSRTVGENIAMAAEAGEEEICSAARTAAVDESIEQFVRGYDTLVGERGVTLSGGQKQRVAIARTLVQGTPILVFDDSLSAVDAETDAKIRRALAAYTGQATVILISHRIATLREADQILVLEHGRVTQQGTHEELAGQPGLYREICAIQDPEEGGMCHAGA